MKIILSLLLLVFLYAPAHAEFAYNKKIYDAASMGATVNSSGVDVSGAFLGSVQAVWSGGGSPVGTFTLEVSNDEVSLPSSVVNWSTYAGSAVAIAADGDLTYNVANLGYRFVRVKYTRTSGTATLNAQLIYKSSERL